MPNTNTKMILRRRFIGGAACVVGYFCNHLDEPRQIGAEILKPAPTTPTDIIDVHVHAVRTYLSNSPADPGPEESIDRLADSVRTEMKKSGTTHALCMPQYGRRAPDDLLGVRGTLAVQKLVPGIHAIGVADPTLSDVKSRKQVEATLETGKVKALKCYLGYVYAMPTDEGYTWYYHMAKKYKIPVIFHTGDTYSRTAKLKFTVPLAIDEVAVDFPDVNFVMAHLGNPWITEAAEVLYKNNQFGDGGNVWADLSALFVGDPEASEQNGQLKSLRKQVRHAIAYSERPDRFLYGSDWPLASMSDYRDFVRDAVPVEYHAGIFRDNAKSLFRL